MRKILLIKLFMVFGFYSAFSQIADTSFNNTGRYIFDSFQNMELLNINLDSSNNIYLAGSYQNFTPDSNIIIKINSQGVLDPEFANNGVFNSSDQKYKININTSMIQQDGKIIIGGNYNNSFALERIDSTGLLDYNFGDSGIAVTDINTGFDNINAISFQSDNKIIVFGYSNSGSYQNTLVRYEQDGSIDSTFGNNGIVLIPENYIVYQSGTFGNRNTLAIQRDDKIIISTNALDNTDVTISRFKSDGSIDSSFGQNGTSVIYFSGYKFGVNAIKLQKDEKIIIAGYIFQTSEFENDFFAARLLDNGNLDTDFGSNGKAEIEMSGTWHSLISIAIQRDDKILLAGTTGSGGGGAGFTLVRLKPEGLVDLKFGQSGFYTSKALSQVFCKSVLIDSYDRVILGGYSLPDLDEKYCLITERLVIDSSHIFTDVNTIESAKNLKYSIYPNPLNNISKLEYYLNQNSIVSLELYNLNGKLISVPFTNKVRTFGKQIENLDFMHNVSPGIYIIILQIENKRYGIKIIK